MRGPSGLLLKCGTLNLFLTQLIYARDPSCVSTTEYFARVKLSYFHSLLTLIILMTRLHSTVYDNNSLIILMLVSAVACNSLNLITKILSYAGKWVGFSGSWPKIQ